MKTPSGQARRWSLTVLLCILTLPADAHDAPGHRATLVVRDAGHISLTVQCDLLQALGRTVAPEQALGVFLTQASAMSADAFAALWMRARRQWESEFALLLADGSRTKGSQWRWPSPQTAQSILREYLMDELTRPASGAVRSSADHAHARLEFSADFIVQGVRSASETVGVELSVSPAFAPLRLTAYRPQQYMIDSRVPRVRIRF